MSARILVIDDIEANVRLLEAKLTAEYFNVITASDGEAALAMARTASPDIILLDVMMPGLSGFEVCRRLKDDQATQHIPVVLVTALDGRADRLAGLEAGADEFLTKPIDDAMLLARVRGLTRLKMAVDELRLREASGRRIGVIASSAARLAGGGGRVLILDDNKRQADRIAAELQAEHRPVVEQLPELAQAAAQAAMDLVIVNLDSAEFDGLRVVAALRSDEATRHLPILAVMDTDQRPKLVKAIELGANDVLARPIDPLELSARVRTQIRHKRYGDLLRDNLDHSFELAVTDQLTGLHNRRFMLQKLGALVARAAMGGEPMSLLMVDIDHFKAVNDRFGHDVGDAVLAQFALHMSTHVRAMDIACRAGGEEFVVLMPNTRLEAAHQIADRLRLYLAGEAYALGEGRESLAVTVSIGVAATLGANDQMDAVLKRADLALYEAKAAGRNQVISQAA
jgi:two-component system cell cycle response regulator